MRVAAKQNKKQSNYPFTNHDQDLIGIFTMKRKPKSRLTCHKHTPDSPNFRHQTKLYQHGIGVRSEVESELLDCCI